jgi:Spy/CpxP family protein refolding chaperone
VARNVSIVVSDDIDGSAGAETVTFGINGVSYEIDLAEKNRAKFEKAFAPYIEHGRRVARSRRRTTSARAGGAQPDRAAVRAWARERGLRVSERGRISADVLRQYEAAEGD